MHARLLMVMTFTMSTMMGSKSKVRSPTLIREGLPKLTKTPPQHTQKLFKVDWTYRLDPTWKVNRPRAPCDAKKTHQEHDFYSQNIPILKTWLDEKGPKLSDMG